MLLVLLFFTNVSNAEDLMKIGENIFLFTPSKVLIVNSEEKSQLEEGMALDEKEVFFKQASGIK